LGYKDYKELGLGEIVVLTDKECKILSALGKDMKICTFLWVQYGYPASFYEGARLRDSVCPLLYACKYFNFSRSFSEMDLITRRVITRLEGEE